MVASSVAIVSPPDGVLYPNTITQPAITVQWAGGVGPFNVEYTWDDDPSFGNANGNQITSTNNGVTSPDTEAPGSDLGDLTAGTTWYVRANVVDTGDSNNALADTHELTLIDPHDFNRYLYALATIGVGFTPTDDPAGGWGTDIGGVEGPDGGTADFRRDLYALATVGVGFKTTDEPVDGWGVDIGGVEGGDGDEVTFNRYLYALANIDSTQPCPFLFSSSKPVAEEGDSIVLRGQGLVSASSPTTDTWGAEVRLYESPSFASSFVILSATSYTSGTLEDTITVTVPVGAQSGFLAVVHTDNPTCDGSNFIGLTVLAVEADPDAGWWAEVWNIRNTQIVIDHVKDAVGASIEQIANDIGGGSLTLPADHRDLKDIVDRTASPAVQRFVKIYLWGRYAYGFFPDDAETTWADDGKRQVTLPGAGPEQMLKWGKVLWADFPSQPARNRQWQYGSTANAASWGSFDPSSQLTNGTFEGADSDPWTPVGGAVLNTGSTVARTGSFALRITADEDEGAQTDLTVDGDRKTYIDGWLYDPTNSSDPVEVRVIGVFPPEDDESEETETVSVDDTINLSNIWQPFTLEFDPDPEASYRLEIIYQGTDTAHEFYLDDVALYSNPEIPTLDEIGAHVELSRVRVDQGLHSLRVDAQADGDIQFRGFIARASVAPNTKYRMRARIWGTDPGEVVRVNLRIGGTAVTTDVAATGGAWDTVELEGTSIATDEVARISFSSRESDAITFYVDSLTLLPGEPAAPPGKIVGDVHAAMAARGALDFLQLGFTATHDSSGNPWPENLALDVPPDWSLHTLIQYFVGLGYSYQVAPVNWVAGGDTGWELSLWAPGNEGFNWTANPDGPAFLAGGRITQAKGSGAPPASTVVYGEGKDGAWAQSVAAEDTINSLERREEFIYNRELTTPTTLSRATSRRLLTARTRGEQASVVWHSSNADPLPYLDYFPLDTLRANLPADVDSAGIPDGHYRVAALSINLTQEEIEGETDLGLYSLHRRSINDQLIQRAVERTRGVDNLTPGTGRVAGSVVESTNTQDDNPGIIAPHDHDRDEIFGVFSPEGPASGDLAGTYPNPSVVRVRGKSVDTPTSKGDLWVYDGTTMRRLPVGINGRVLKANSSETLGVEWAVETGGGGGGGDVGSGSGAVVVDSVSTDGSSPLSVTIPAGVQEGDLVVAAVSTTNSIPNVAGITGFTELLRFDTSSNEWQAIYAKVADATDESNAGSGTWSITHSSGSEAVLAVGVWRGVNTMWSTQWAIDQLQTPWVPAHPEGLMILIYMDLNGSAFVMPTFGGDAALTEVVHHRRASGNNNQIWMGSRDTFSPMDGMPHAITGSAAAGFSLAWVGIFYDS